MFKNILRMSAVALFALTALLAASFEGSVLANGYCSADTTSQCYGSQATCKPANGGLLCVFCGPPGVACGDPAGTCSGCAY
jgi:hypothetical protein